MSVARRRPMKGWSFSFINHVKRRNKTITTKKKEKWRFILLLKFWFRLNEIVFEAQVVLLFWRVS